jgi:hypothetical protein
MRTKSSGASCSIARSISLTVLITTILSSNPATSQTVLRSGGRFSAPTPSAAPACRLQRCLSVSCRIESRRREPSPDCRKCHTSS